MEMAADDLYDVLGLEPGASREQVERAYRFSLEMYGEDALATYSLLEPAELESMRARIREGRRERLVVRWVGGGSSFGGDVYRLAAFIETNRFLLKKRWEG